MKKQATYILTAEAKDLYGAKNGYSIRRQDNTINTKHFINALDYSLDLIKLREVYEKVYRRHDFTFSNGKKDFTRHVINVKFNYSYKSFNKIGSSIFLADGYQRSDIDLKDHICIKDGQLVAIECNVPVENLVDDISVLGKSFYCEDGMYKCNDKFDVLMSRSDLREHLYENGFICDGIKFVRWKRSSGSSRVGKCLFIDEKLYYKMHKWETCGLKIKEGSELDLAAFEAYIALTSSSIIDTIDIEPKNFLIVDDYESVFKDKVMGVHYENGELTAQEEEIEVTNSIFDGESLIDESIIPDEYKQKSMLLLRNRMFKSACFKTKIQQWFVDNGITDVEQLNGFTLAENIEDIKVITTPSSIKYVKFGKIEQWLGLIEPTFGLVKYEKPTHYFDGRKVSCHYQLINTLQLSEDDVNELLADSLDYIRQIRSDPAVLRYHISYPYDEMDITPLNSKNEIVFKLLGMNSNFAKTKMYIEFRNDLVKSLLRELKQGHVLINGNYSTLLGNGYEMLQQAIGTFKGESIIGYGNIHSTRFEYGKTILGSRSPHVCSGNILLVQNVASEEIDRYFELSNEVVYVNAINENIQQRLNGADYDSDTLLLTDCSLFVERAKQNYDKFLVPTSFIPSKKRKRFYSCLQQADLDVKTSVNKIGDIINTSQQLNSLYWENLYKGKNLGNNKELYQDICKLAILSNVEIDKSKKEYELNTEQELKIIKQKHKMKHLDHKTGVEKTVKPMFFKMITQENGYKLSPTHHYRYFHTPMDYLQKAISKFNFHNARESKDDIQPFAVIVQPSNKHNIAGAYYAQRNRVLDIIMTTKAKIDKLYMDYDNKTKEEKVEVREMVANIKQECVEYIDGLTLSCGAMYLLLCAIDSKEYNKCKRLLFTSLFGTPNKSFFELIQQNDEPIMKLEETPDGDIKLYDYSFTKVEV